jgi:hypothetical protein
MDNKHFINSAGLNFYDIKYNFINYLKNQPEFTDYDLEGSNLTILLDILSYNTSQQGFYNAMVANEMFIERATKRSSIVSIAKSLGYTPSTKKAARAKILVVVDAENVPPSKTIEKGSLFTGTRNNQEYTFTNTESYSFYPYTFETSTDPEAVQNGNILTYACGPFEIKQGILNTISYNVASYDQQFVITDTNADKDTLKVFVLNSINDTTGINIPWVASNNITSLDENARAFFVEENSFGQLSLSFGDGVLGRKLETGNIIIVEYLNTFGSFANGTGTGDTEDRRSFTLDSDNIFTVFTIEPANSGMDKETSSSIKRNAVRNFTSRERAVTTKDYEGLVMGSLNDDAAVRCWGGEDNDPPYYGKVFVSVRPIGKTSLSTEEKTNLVNNILSQKNIVGTDTIFVDPEVLYVVPTIDVYYEKSLTTDSESSITKNIKDRLIVYMRKNLVEFGDSIFSFDVENEIKKINVSFKSIETNFILERRIEPTLNVSERIIVDFQNELYHPFAGHQTILTTNKFFISERSGFHYIEDDGNGKLILKKIVNGIVSVVNSNYGTINYITGRVEIPMFKVFSIENNSAYVQFRATPKANNIFTQRNSILQYDYLDNTALTINLNKVVTQQVIGGSGTVITRPNF